MERYILLSIQPKIVKEIIDGTKKFEFRKKFPNLEEGNVNKKIIIYSSKPTMKIIGSYVVKTYYHSDFCSLMNKVNATTAYEARISKYFTNKDSCHAMEISELKIYDTPLSLEYLRKSFPGFVPGQSYRYLNNLIVDNILMLNGYI